MVNITIYQYEKMVVYKYDIIHTCCHKALSAVFHRYRSPQLCRKTAVKSCKVSLALSPPKMTNKNLQMYGK